MFRYSLSVVGSIAALAVSCGAVTAADFSRPSSVDYVKVCDAYGAGFFYIPGTETCLRIGGLARLDAWYSEADYYLLLNRKKLYDRVYSYRNWSTTATLARARFDFEARTGTEFGLLRSVARIELEVGGYNEPFDPFSINFRNQAFNNQIAREAYIQWGGLTAGLTYSLFNLPFFLTYSNPYTSDLRTRMLAYTFDSNGFSASVALEDPTVGRRGYIGPSQLGNPVAGNYGGLKYPDIVGVLKYTGRTFTIQGSAAAHQIVRSSFDFPAYRNIPGVEEWGYAAQIGAQWKFSSAGSLYGGIAYTEGASNFSGLGADDDRLGNGVGFAVTDGYVRRQNGRFEPTKVLSSHVGAGYAVTSTVRVAGSLGHARVEDDFRVLRFGRGPRADYDSYKAIGLVEWNPVQDIRIGTEFGYSAVEFDKESKEATLKNFGAQYRQLRLRDFDRLTAMLRVERRF